MKGARALETAAVCGHSPAKSLNIRQMMSQRKVWDREYARRGTRWSKATLTLPEAFGGLRVLEVGAGNGKTLASILEQAPSEAVAVDFSSAALEACGECARGRASLVAADAVDLPFPDGSFDAVVLYFILDNLLSAGRKAAVSEAWRVLADGGLLAFEDFAVGDFRQSAKPGQPDIEPGTVQKGKGLICHYFSRGEVEGLLAIFDGVDAEERSYEPFRRSGGLVRRVVSALARKGMRANQVK
jgi:SAM-dependent methyltransferase